MQFRLEITDKLAALTELDVLQVQRIAFLQLLDVERDIHRVTFEIKPYLCGDFNCKYQVSWTIELVSGHLIMYRRTEDSIGSAVLASANQMQRKVHRRIAFENTITSRVFQTLKRSLQAAAAPHRSKRTARCA